MAKRVIIEYQSGDLVRWHERYADGFMIKDAGDGIVVRKRSFNLDYKESPYVNYLVYRTKHKDTMIFEEIELEPLTENTQPVKIEFASAGEDNE